MNITAQKLAVEAAELRVRALRANAAEKSVALRRRAERRWLPAALLGAGALAGFWLDSHLSGGSRSVGHDQPDDQSSPSKSSSVAPTLGALATASMLLKLWRDFAPIAGHVVQLTRARASQQAHYAQSPGQDPAQVPDATPTQR